MKIQCGVCDREEASVFCSADEAALCEGCDRRVHYANKLAGKHTRFSLLQPAFKESPLCDICQEKRAFIFCQEDRAILCIDCDLTIHRANEHTKKHNRYLLTGAKLSASSSLYQSSTTTTSTTTSSETAANEGTEYLSTIPSITTRRGRAISLNNNNEISSSLVEISPLPTTSDNGSYSTSSISEYLMETLPGWHVEDFLDPSSFASNGHCKTNSQYMGCVDGDFESKKSSLDASSQDLANNGVFREPNYSVKSENVLFNQNWDNFTSTTFPQFGPPTFKRQRHFH